MSVFATILTIVTLVFGGAGVTAAAAQASLPDQALYPLKLLTETVRADLAFSPQSQVQLAMEMDARRAEEIQQMVASGHTLQVETIQRFQEQLNLTLKLAADLPEEQLLPLMEQLQQRLQTYDQILARLGQQVSDPLILQQMLQTRQQIQERLRLLQLGLENPLLLQEQLRLQKQMENQQQERQGMPEGAGGAQNTPAAGELSPSTTAESTGQSNGQKNGSGDCGTCTPIGSATGSGSNPWTTGTPTPYSGYGPGPGPDYTPTCEPNDYNSPGPHMTASAGDDQSQPTQASAQATDSPADNSSGGNSDSGSGNGKKP